MRRNILVVDDSVTARHRVCSLLEAEGHTTTQAANGVDAVAIAANDDFDLILMDVNMPVLNGMGALERLKKKASTAGVPVVMVTTEKKPPLVRRAKELGAAGWLVKPYSPEALSAVVGKVA